MKQCINCGTMIKDEDRFCIKCGTKQDDVQEQTNPANFTPTSTDYKGTVDNIEGIEENEPIEYIEESDENITEDSQDKIVGAMIRRCPNCGAPIKVDEKSCNNCGKVFDFVPEDENETKGNNKVNKPEMIIPDGAKCRYCLGPISKETGECILCHRPFYEIVPEPVVEEKKKEKKPKEPDKPQEPRCRFCNGLISKETGKCVLCNRPYYETESTKVAVVKESEYTLNEVIDGSVTLKYNKNIINLWSNLLKSFNRKMYFVEKNMPNETIFMKKVQQKIDENGIPANIISSKMCWDDNYGKLGSAFFIDIGKGRQDLSNPFSIVLKCKNVGKFSFVEKSTFITPPNLPKYPGEKIDIYESEYAKQKFLYMGIIGILIAIYLSKSSAVFAGIFGFVGLIFSIIGGIATYNIRSAEKNNAYVDQEWDAWDDAWYSWETKQLRHAYQEVTGGIWSRISEAVFACVDQVCDEEFGSKRVNEESGGMKINELQDIVAEKKRKRN